MISYESMKQSDNSERDEKIETKSKSSITKVTTEEQVLEQLLGSKSQKASADKADSKSRLALDSWKSRFFTLLHDLKRTLLKKKDIVVSSPWILDEIETRIGTKMLKKQSKPSKKESTSDEDSIDLEALDPSKDPSTIRCNFSRIQIYIQRLFRQLFEHVNIIEQLLLPLNASLETDSSHHHSKNPLYRALSGLSHSERETLFQYCNNQINSCKQECEKLDTKEPILLPKSKERRSKSPSSTLPEPSPRPLLSLSHIASMMDPSKSQQSATEEQDIMILKSGSQRLDGQLEDVSHGVSHLKVIAQDIGQEVSQQNQTIPDISVKMDQVDAELQIADSKVRKALSKLGRSRWPWYFILCVILCVEWVIIIQMTFLGERNGWRWKTK